MSRLSPVNSAAFSEDELRAYEHVISVRHNPRGPTAIWSRSPVLAEAAVKFGDYIRFSSTLRGDLRELAILVTARACDAQNEWFAHRPLAEREGVPDEVIEQIAQRRRPNFPDAAAAAVFDVAAVLNDSQDIDDETWSRAVDVLGERALVELISTIGFYTMIAMLLKATRAALPAGVRPPLEI